MNLRMHKKTIKLKTLQVGAFTLLSRALGTLREILNLRFFGGFSILSDAFIVAFKIPNLLRKIFAEGALSAAVVPTFTKILKEEGQKEASSFLTASFIFFEGIIIILSILVFFFAKYIVIAISPGFSTEQLNKTAEYLKILFPFIFFISGSSILAAALQAVNHFAIPASASSILNVAWISTLILGLKFGWSVEYLCYGILLGGLILFIAHLITYFKYNFSIEPISDNALNNLKSVLKKFAPSLLGVGIIELNLFIDTSLASFLPQGSVSTIYYGTRFMQIPLSVFATAFSTVLLTHFSRVVLYAPKRLYYYMLEAIKLVFWIIVPSTIFLIFISEELFSILLLGKNSNAHDIWQASWVLTIMACGLIFFSLNKILSNVFYSLHDTVSPTLLGAIASVINFIGNLLSLFFLKGSYATFGIVASTVISNIVIVILSFWILKVKYNFKFYTARLVHFAMKYIPQIIITSILFWAIYSYSLNFIEQSSFSLFFKQEWGYWLFVLPIAAVAFSFLLLTKRIFGVRLYFLN